MFPDKKKIDLIFSPLTLIFIFGLAVYAFWGFYNRYWADDWCYNADYRTMGFWGIIAGYNYITYYASNRLSLTLFSDVFEIFGLFGVQILPFLIISFWSLAIYLNLQNLTKRLAYQVNKLLLILICAAIPYISLFLAPNQFQILYWRSGALPYTAPLIGSLYVSAIILSTLNQAKTARSFLKLLGLFLLVLITDVTQP